VLIINSSGGPQAHAHSGQAFWRASWLLEKIKAANDFATSGARTKYRLCPDGSAAKGNLVAYQTLVTFVGNFGNTREQSSVSGCQLSDKVGRPARIKPSTSCHHAVAVATRDPLFLQVALRHHATHNFEEELLAILKKSEVAYDDLYIFG